MRTAKPLELLPLAAGTIGPGDDAVPKAACDKNTKRPTLVSI